MRSLDPWTLAVLAGFYVAAAWGLGPAAISTASGARLSAVAEPSAAAPSSLTASMCLRCHPNSAVRSHPMGIVPTMNIPANLPLENGRITCLTCHEMTERHPDPAAGAALRGMPAGTGAAIAGAFCEQCHDPVDGSRASGHAGAIAKAHRAVGRTRGSMSGMAAGGPDRQSTLCLECHDGTIGTDTAMGLSISQRHEAGVRADHPVGVQYLSGQPNIPLRAASSLPPSVQLVDGAVGCTSCHDLYSLQPARLAMPNDHSRLCLSCHDQ